MVRIISGLVGGLVLRTLEGSNTRPTTGRVREALFSSLGSFLDWESLQVLDLFAGSGVLGLEAASRGAGRVVLVDSFFGAVRVCRKNVELVGLGGVEVFHLDVRKFLLGCVDSFGLVFVDPPYGFSEVFLGDVLGLLFKNLGVGAVVVVERSVRCGEPVWPVGLERFGQKRYGQTCLWFASRVG